MTAGSSADVVAPQRADVCVVGGGPAGSATAFFLARAGADVLLVDRGRFPRDKPCAEYLSPEASRILAEMNVLDALGRADSSRLAGMRVRAPAGHWMHGEFTAVRGYRGFSGAGIAVRRTVLDAVLLDAARAAGARVVESLQVTDVERDGTGRVRGVLARHGSTAGRAISAGLVIGADGLRSIVSRRTGVARRARWPARVALVTHYAGIAGMTDCGEMHVHPGGYLGLARVGEVTNVALVVPASGARQLAGAAPEYLTHWISLHAHLRERFRGAVRVTPVRATGPFASRVTRAWVPGAAVVGDAADFYDPFTGEGIYAALRGAELLAPLVLSALNDPRAEPDAMRAYDSTRRREFGGKWLVERFVAGAVARPWLMNRLTASLARRKALADTLVGVCGDFVPPRELLHARFLLPLLLGAAHATNSA